jgi:preprotein translocase subunit SecY
MIDVSKIARFLPTVEKPTYKQPFNKRLMWTGVALLLYFVLSHITIYGIGQTSDTEYLRTIQLLLGAKFGSLMTLGIGPIVTAGILLQLLVGSKIINWDMSKPENREKFQTWNKFFSIILSFLEAIAYVLAGAVPVAGGTFTMIVVVLQLASGGIIVILLDELVSKWGFGSGISLFIAAGIGSQIAIGAISPFLTPQGDYVGKLWGFISSILANNNFQALVNLLPLIFTGVVFLIVVYVQGIGVNIPLSFSSLRGFGRNWTLKLFYTSNIPVILAAALLAQLQLVSRMTAQSGDPLSCGILGCYDKNGNPISGIIYYLSAPKNLILSVFYPGTFVASEIIRAITYTVFLAVTCMVFSIFWVNTSGMDPASVAEQIDEVGMQIPGYRKDKRVTEAVLKRYIPALAVVGGLLVGLLAAFADFTGALGTGTGMLLTVMIVYNYYEELKAQELEEAHPVVKKILGE